MAFRSRERQLEYHREYDRARAEAAFASRLKSQIGRCERCGYDRFLGALSWHHLVECFKSGKDFRRLRPIEAAKELYFCLLLCENCHREAHGGLWNPFELRAAIG